MPLPLVSGSLEILSNPRMAILPFKDSETSPLTSLMPVPKGFFQMISQCLFQLHYIISIPLMHALHGTMSNPHILKKGQIALLQGGFLFFFKENPLGILFPIHDREGIEW